MKVAVFSDIHGNYEALKTIIEDIKINNYDEIICLGDVVGLGPNPKECLDLIRNNNIILLLGNHELYCIKGTEINEMSSDEKSHHVWVNSQLTKDDLNYLGECKYFYEKKIFDYKLLFEHFLLKDEIYPYMSLNIVKNHEIVNSFNDIKSDYIFIGHEHESFECDNENGTNLICVGSSGCRKDDNTFYTIIDIGSEINITKKYLNYDREKFEEIFKKVDYPDKDKINKIFFGVK